MKVLVVEDERRLAEYIKKGLEENSFLVDTAFDGEMGLTMAFDNDYDAIILDVNMPKINGFDLTRRIRNEKQNTPILMLTAMGTLNDKIVGFEAGIDDFLVKPFQFQELIIRLNALYRRSSLVQNQLKKNVLKIGTLELDLSSKMLTREGKHITLTAKEYALLEYLMINENRVISRMDIAEKIWETNLEATSNTIETYINFLRKKIDRDFEPKLIHTVVGMGYVLKVGI